MAITSFGLDEFVSQELSKLTACAPQSLAEAFPYREDWLTHFVLRRMFQNHVPSDKAGAAFVLVRRTYAALDEWELACTTATSNVHKPAVYFTGQCQVFLGHHSEALLRPIIAAVRIS